MWSLIMSKIGYKGLMIGALALFGAASFWFAIETVKKNAVLEREIVQLETTVKVKEAELLLQSELFKLIERVSKENREREDALDEEEERIKEELKGLEDRESSELLKETFRQLKGTPQ